MSSLTFNHKHCITARGIKQPTGARGSIGEEVGECVERWWRQAGQGAAEVGWGAAQPQEEGKVGAEFYLIT